VWSSHGPVQVQSGERGAAWRPVRDRSAPRRRVSPAHFTWVMRADGVCGKGKRRGDAVSQTADTHEREAGDPERRRACVTELALRRLPPSPTCCPAAFQCTALSLARSAGSLRDEKWSQRAGTRTTHVERVHGATLSLQHNLMRSGETSQWDRTCHHNLFTPTF